LDTGGCIEQIVRGNIYELLVMASRSELNSNAKLFFLTFRVALTYPHRDLKQQPPDKRIHHSNFVNVAPLQLSEEIALIHVTNMFKDCHALATC
jgi:hypothetical protein